MPLFQTIVDLRDGETALRRRRYGVIETAAGRLVGVHLRPWPKLISLPEALWLGSWQHNRISGDRCWLYYNQPLGHSSFLALKYVLSGRDCSFATARAAITVLEAIARIKTTDAIVCHVTSSRISDRLLAREGWEQHCLWSRQRHFIKRFYGEYPAPAAGSLSQG
jgi:hypothetical protein